MGFGALAKKSLNWLKQTSSQWFAKLYDSFPYLGFTLSKNDYSLFIQKFGTDITVTVVYINDILLTCSNDHENSPIVKVVDYLTSTTDVKYKQIIVSKSEAGVSHYVANMLVRSKLSPKNQENAISQEIEIRTSDIRFDAQVSMEEGLDIGLLFTGFELTDQVLLGDSFLPFPQSGVIRSTWKGQINSVVHVEVINYVTSPIDMHTLTVV
ncbi:hypothetical protein AKJ16_DCAP11207 [Drosera capensis]